MGDQALTDFMSIFARFGFSAGDAYSVKNNTLAGVLFTGIIPTRPDDKLGLGFSSVASVEANQLVEWALELSYRLEIGWGISVQPDLQYVRNPSFGTTASYALDGAVRFEVNF